MTVRQLSSLFGWPRPITAARIALAALALARIYSLPNHISPALHVVLWIFLVYTVPLAIQNGWQRGAFGLLALFGDTVFFLILAGFWADVMPWLTTAFYILLTVEAVAFFRPVEVFLVVATCCGFCLLVPGSRSIALARTAIAAGGMTCVASVWKRRLERDVTSLKTHLLETQKAKEKALESERQRIASDFHDGPLQSFISLQMRLDILRRLLERDLASGLEDLRQLQSLAQSQVRELRAFLNSMRPADVDGNNLMASARRTAEHFQKESGIPVTFLGANTPVGLPREASAEVLQMLREALHNVQKHSGATRVAVAVDKSDRGLELSVDDNGRGFAFSGSYSLEELELLRLGPASLKRRARSLNAEMVLESRPGRGAGLKFRIPI
ncbi:MAG: sensor histidine kinase [Acidobacteriia bacterium]|nr:sensor histidine kinase [Terriglobia bacterium]